MEASTIVERRRERETAVQRLTRQSGEMIVSLTRMGVLAAVLAPFFFVAFLTVDLPMRAFDGLAGGAIDLRPSNWLSRGGFIMGLAPLVAILFARKFGGEEASRAITAAWTIAALGVFAELSYLAPQLEEGDMPPARFAVFFVASAMAAQYVAVNLYDIARGGARWWRAPLFAALGGYLVHALIYFPGLFFGAGAPWLTWMVADIAIMTAVTVAFLPVYASLRGTLRPSGGYGGR